MGVAIKPRFNIQNPEPLKSKDFKAPVAAEVRTINADQAKLQGGNQGKGFVG